MTPGESKRQAAFIAAAEAKRIAAEKTAKFKNEEAIAAKKLLTMSDREIANAIRKNDLYKLAAETTEKALSYTKQLETLQKNAIQDKSKDVSASKKLLKVYQDQIAAQDKIDALMGGFKKKFKQFYDLATDPKIARGLFLVAAADKAMEIKDTLMDAQHSMGLSYTQGLAMAGTLGKASLKGMALGIGFEKSAKAAGALATEMGDLGSVTSTAIVAVAKLSKTYGVTEASGAKLFKQIKLMSNESDEMVKHQMLSVANLAKANNVAPGKVMEDMAQSSEFMAKFGGKSALSMAETAVQAAKLGTNMSSIDQMMTSILDIETSIEKEMQVSVLLGRQISFDKARQLAMAGDTVGATKAILKQVGGIAEFEKMSVIQRKALADAAGVDLATMQSMIGNKEKQIEMGLVEASTLEKSLGFIMGAGTTIKKNMGLLASMSNMLVNWNGMKIKERIADGVEFAKKVGRWAAEKAHLVWKMATSSKFRKDQAKALKEGLNGIKDKAKAMLTGDGGKKDAKGMLRNVKGQFMKDPSKIKSMAKPDLKSLKGPSKIKSMAKPDLKSLKGPSKIKSMPKGPKGKVSDMGVSKLGKNMKNIVMGAAAMVLVAGAVFIFGKAVQEFMSVSWSAVGMAVVSMLALVGAVALLGAIMMSGVGALAIIAGAAAMLIVAGAMLVLAVALKIVSEAVPNFLLLIPMLPELAIGLLTLVPAIPVMPLIGYGLILLGAGFGVAAIGVGLFGLVGGTEIITGLAAGMAILTPLAAGIASLGPAFGSMAMGIAALAGSLVLLTPMLPTLLLLGGVAMAVGAITGGLGEEGGKDDNSNVIAEKLDILIGLMSQPGVVKMDGKKVGDVIALARGPMGT